MWIAPPQSAPKALHGNRTDDHLTTAEPRESKFAVNADRRGVLTRVVQHSTVITTFVSRGGSMAAKASARKATAKKAPAKKSTAKKSTAKKSTAKKTTAKKAPAKKTTAKKTTAKKAGTGR
ncbi:MAG: histone H1-like repetitive region-containing protein [Actinomycetota bacterium]|nr:histone H1-like repetitive region-containing protein [Actinomycetota bacterium]